MTTYIHSWTRQVADWCYSQGVGTIRIESIDTGDWPAYKFIQLLSYKAQELGITISQGADVREKSGERAIKSIVTARQRKARRRTKAVRELQHQLGA